VLGEELLTAQKNIIEMRILIIYILFISSVFSQTDSIHNIHIKWLTDNLIKINSIEPSDENFIDLQPLKKIIGDSVDIVLLGEGSHGDGATFLAKTRLIKFLHKEMGFDILAMESGLYECNKAWQLIKEEIECDTAINKSVFQIWTKSIEFQPLIRYICGEKNTTRPLELTGFDCQFTGKLSRNYLLEDFDRLIVKLNDNDITSEDTMLFKSVTGSVMHNYQFRVDSLIEINYNRVIQKLITSIEKKADKDLVLWTQLLRSISLQTHRQRVYIYYYQDSINYSKDPEIVNMRDIQMGKNLVWLKNNIYKDKKIIVWAASVHNSRNGSTTENDYPFKDYDGSKAVMMGDIVWKEFGDKIYNIGFAAYRGKAGTVFMQKPFDLEKPRKGSIEYLIHKTGIKNAILNYRNNLNSGKWLTEKLYSRPFGYSEDKANWTQIMDALFYIEEMTPSTKK